jgi:SAM-dependent methyltransferase
VPGNILDPLPFADNTFDLVNARFLIGVLHRDRWPTFVSECRRVVRPDGLIRLTEGDRAGHSNKPACEQFATWAIALFHQSNYGFGNDPRSAGLTAHLPSLLQQAGCQRIFQHTRMVDCSFGTDFYASQSQNWRIAYMQMQPVLRRLGIATTAEIEETYELLLKELIEPDFRATTTLVTVLGSKPCP